MYAFEIVKVGEYIVHCVFYCCVFMRLLLCLHFCCVWLAIAFEYYLLCLFMHLPMITTLLCTIILLLIIHVICVIMLCLCLCAGYDLVAACVWTFALHFMLFVYLHTEYAMFLLVFLHWL